LDSPKPDEIQNYTHKNPKFQFYGKTRLKKTVYMLIYNRAQEAGNVLKFN